jgi:hypothetical protein
MAVRLVASNSTDYRRQEASPRKTAAAHDAGAQHTRCDECGRHVIMSRPVIGSYVCSGCR